MIKNNKRNEQQGSISNPQREKDCGAHLHNFRQRRLVKVILKSGLVHVALQNIGVLGA